MPMLRFLLGQALLQEGDRDGAGALALAPGRVWSFWILSCAKATKMLAACMKGHPRACFQDRSFQKSADSLLLSSAAICVLEVAEMYREGQHKFPKDRNDAVSLG